MILTCPDCAARFVIDDRALGPSGRTVRCGACGHAWHQFPDPVATPAAGASDAAADTLPDAAIASAPASAAQGEAAPAMPPITPSSIPPSSAAASSPATEAEMRQASAAAAAALNAAALTAATSGAAATADVEGERARRGAGRVFAWFLFIFAVAVIVVGGIKFRNDVVRIWPPATRIYQAVGLDVAPPARFGLHVPPESIKFRREGESGVPTLVVSGEIANRSDKPLQVTPMRIVLLDKDGRELQTERVTIEAKVLDPGKAMPFQHSIANPREGAAAVRISFD